MATLLRVDLTQALLHNDYDERASLTTDTKTRKKWAEYTVVLQATKLLFYTSNKAAASPSSSPALTIPLPGSQVSLFSPLDKTLSITRRDNITSIYYLCAPTTATAVEWYTKLRELTGHERAKSLEIKIPDLNASLRLDDPFKGTKRNAAPTTETCAAENNIAGDIIARCTEMLKQSPEWTDVLNGWLSNGKIGLAWKRYDRLEWISGALEHNMYGTIAMARNYDLELRPQIHYPTTAKLPNGETMKEPAPVEGFLIRLTSQKGQERRFGKMMYKRLYFHTKNQYLLFCKPGKAIPPTSTNDHIRQNDGDGTYDNPHSHQNAPNHGIVPYSINDDTNVTDGHDGAQLPHNQQSRERDNEAESERNMSLMLSSKGFIYLCDVKNVRTYTDGATPADENIDDGPDVDFHDMEDRDDRREHDGSTTEVDQDRILELALKNGLVIRLQASNKATRNEWMRRLRQLVEYWTQRTKADMDLYKTVRDQVCCITNPRCARTDFLPEPQGARYRRTNRSWNGTIRLQMGSQPSIRLAGSLQHVRNLEMPNDSRIRHTVSQATQAHDL